MHGRICSRPPEGRFAKQAICDDPCSREECRKCVNTPEANQTPYGGPGDENVRVDLDFCPVPIDPVEPTGMKQGSAPDMIVHDPVRKPFHYTRGGIEVIDFIQAWGLNYAEGNVVKYITRYKFKGGPTKAVQDLEKAKQYIDFLIRDLKKDKE